ncbi:hypothetical protein BU23DRAFT_548474 [Bimuria novae-zelandiae CBS 107.79]|uniref:Uncharacterized protein n=1 Tax=Bimuria novae-zelandiae CBS 107.79 TaxID=1447943 RepID=A0A6A5VSI1_9PLEO|nr:hypothetical protein BU23DRAFT_548474 [Bimuria novae-zelandiae CBS 107.79]
MTEADSLVTKSTVVLNRPADGTKWLFLRKDSAERNQLWQYVQVRRQAKVETRILREGES